MAEPQTNEVIVVHLEYIREKQDEIVTHLTALNGRVGKTENRLTAVETRTDEAKQQGGKWGAIVGGAIAGAGTIWQLLRGGQ